jgi:hypothetical protein
MFYSENSSVCEGHKNRPLRITDPELAFQTAYNVLRFKVLACGEELCNNRYLLRLGLRRGEKALSL